jgi:hypothetical protein
MFYKPIFSIICPPADTIWVLVCHGVSLEKSGMVNYALKVFDVLLKGF